MNNLLGQKLWPRKTPQNSLIRSKNNISDFNNELLSDVKNKER